MLRNFFDQIASLFCFGTVKRTTINTCIWSSISAPCRSLSTVKLGISRSGHSITPSILRRSERSLATRSLGSVKKPSRSWISAQKKSYLGRVPCVLTWSNLPRRWLATKPKPSKRITMTRSLCGAFERPAAWWNLWRTFTRTRCEPSDVSWAFRRQSSKGIPSRGLVWPFVSSAVAKPTWIGFGLRPARRSKSLPVTTKCAKLWVFNSI